MKKHLHIVCLDVPYPVDYGGVVDLFYKLKYLHENGITIHLHCFEYGRGEQPALLQYCETVHYYKRKKLVSAFSFITPYIIKSRANRQLLKNLSVDKYPVLLEGIHCTWWLYKNKLANRTTILRLHNIEHSYYAQLAVNTSSWFRKLYYFLESRLLKKYQKKIAGLPAAVLCVSKKEKNIFETTYGSSNVHYLPVFTSWNKITSLTGRGNYCLYHGNLSVAENEKAALWLVEKVFKNLSFTLVIAGKKPSDKLKSSIRSLKNATLISDPPADEMELLIRQAHIHLLPSFTDTGIKLKFLHAVFCGRHCITNAAMMEGTGLEQICYAADDDKDFAALIIKLFDQPFTDDQIQLRQTLLERYFNNQKNVVDLIRFIYPQQL